MDYFHNMDGMCCELQVDSHSVTEDMGKQPTLMLPQILSKLIYVK